MSQRIVEIHLLANYDRDDEMPIQDALIGPLETMVIDPRSERIVAIIERPAEADMGAHTYVATLDSLVDAAEQVVLDWEDGAASQTGVAALRDALQQYRQATAGSKVLVGDDNSRSVERL